MRQIVMALVSLAMLVTSSLANTVPNVLGMSFLDAARAIERAGLRPVRSTEGRISSFTIGAVAAQSPLGNIEAKAGSTVTIYPSVGVWLKDFSGSTASAARLELAGVGLAAETVGQQISGVALGIVARQEPPGGQLVDASKTTVRLIAGVGPWIEVPNLKDSSFAAAKAQLLQLQLSPAVHPGDPDKNSETGLGSSGKGKGMCMNTPIIATVVSSDPLAGTMLYPGQSVELHTTNVLDHKHAETGIPCSCKGNGTQCVPL